MLRLHAPVSQPFRLAVKAAPSDTVALTITPPTGPDVPLALSLDGDVHSGQWTPQVAGSHTVTVTTTADPDLLGLSFVVDVGDRSVAPLVFDRSQLDPVSGLETGHKVRWPCPNLASLPCITEWEAEPIERWMAIATRTLYDDTCRRFPGVHNYARLRPRGSSGNLCRVGSTFGIDLNREVRYPILELLDVEQDGASIGTDGWRIEERRYLVPEPGTLWPSQNLQEAPGEAGTWSVTVRYGRMPDPLAVVARDRWAYSMLVDTEPTSSGSLACSSPKGLTQIVEGGRTLAIDPEHASASAALAEAAKRRWRCRAKGPRLFDPAEASARATDLAPVVAGDPTPLSHAAFLASGCDLAQVLADLAAP